MAVDIFILVSQNAGPGDARWKQMWTSHEGEDKSDGEVREVHLWIEETLYSSLDAIPRGHTRRESHLGCTIRS